MKNKFDEKNFVLLWMYLTQQKKEKKTCDKYKVDTKRRKIKDAK